MASPSQKASGGANRCTDPSNPNTLEVLAYFSGQLFDPKNAVLHDQQLPAGYQKAVDAVAKRLGIEQLLADMLKWREYQREVSKVWNSVHDAHGRYSVKYDDKHILFHCGEENVVRETLQEVSRFPANFCKPYGESLVRYLRHLNETPDVDRLRADLKSLSEIWYENTKEQEVLHDGSADDEAVFEDSDEEDGAEAPFQTAMMLGYALHFAANEIHGHLGEFKSQLVAEQVKQDPSGTTKYRALYLQCMLDETSAEVQHLDLDDLMRHCVLEYELRKASLGMIHIERDHMLSIFQSVDGELASRFQNIAALPKSIASMVKKVIAIIHIYETLGISQSIANQKIRNCQWLPKVLNQAKQPSQENNWKPEKQLVHDMLGAKGLIQLYDENVN